MTSVLPKKVKKTAKRPAVSIMNPDTWSLGALTDAPKTTKQDMNLGLQVDSDFPPGLKDILGLNPKKEKIKAKKTKSGKTKAESISDL